MTTKDSASWRPAETVVLRKCPDPVDGGRAFITRRITVEHCEKLQGEGFHACGGCVHAKADTLAKWRDAVDVLVNEQPAADGPVFIAKDDPFQLQLRAAQTWADLEEAYCLVHRAFRAEGLPETGPAKIRINPFSRLPDARTFTVARENRLIGVLTVLPDSALGLPSDELYHSELKALRDSGEKLCEVSGLAVESEDKRLARVARLLLFRTAYRYALRAFQAGDICVLAPKHHEKYYRRLFMFQRLGEPRIYSLGGDPCPAVGLRLDVERAPGYFKAAYGGRKGTKNLYEFFVKREVRGLNSFLDKIRKRQAIGQIGGPGHPTLLIPRRSFGRP